MNEQPRVVYQEFAAACIEQLNNCIQALSAIQSNEEESKDDELIEYYENEKAKYEQISEKLKDMKKQLLN